MEITREEFEAAISHLVTQAEIACETALMNSKVAKSDIKEVFMSGGTSRALAIQRSVERMFGKKPIIRNPEHAVALGACVYAAQKTNPKVLTPMQRETMGQTKVSDVSPHFLGILAREPTGELINQVMIRKGIPVPCHETIRLWPINHNITSVRLSLTQSAIEEPNVDFVSVLTDIQIKVPAISNPVLRVKIGYDTNGTATLNTKWESDSDSALDFMIKAPKPRPPASRSHAAERRLLLPGSSD
jgi:molecular chaperone DnaK (HSP70)